MIPKLGPKGWEGVSLKRVGKYHFRQIKLCRRESQAKKEYGLFRKLKQANMFGELWTKEASDDESHGFF